MAVRRIPSKDMSLLLGGSESYTNFEAKMRTPMKVQSRISVVESPSHPFRTSPIAIEGMHPAPRSVAESRLRKQRPYPTTKFVWALGKNIARLPSVMGILSGPQRTISPQKLQITARLPIVKAIQDRISRVLRR